MTTPISISEFDNLLKRRLKSAMIRRARYRGDRDRFYRWFGLVERCDCLESLRADLVEWSLRGRCPK